MSDTHNTWHPGPAELESSGVVRLMRALGAASYDDLLATSNAEPERYWDVVMKHCEIEWHAPAQGYVDDSKGPASHAVASA